MKYQVGDIVKIKSIDWYNQELKASNFREVVVETEKTLLGNLYSLVFTPEMRKCCGKTYRIIEVNINNGTYYLNDPEDKNGYKYKWCAEFFEEATSEIEALKINNNDTLRRIIKGLDADVNLSSLYLYVKMLQKGEKVIIPEVGNDTRAIVIAKYIKELKEQILNLKRKS